jgi:hypothetical protein
MKLAQANYQGEPKTEQDNQTMANFEISTGNVA